MPYTEVMHKFKHGELHSGSKKGPAVKKRGQAIAIMLSEKKQADKGKEEYQPKGISASHSCVSKMCKKGKK